VLPLFRLLSVEIRKPTPPDRHHTWSPNYGQSQQGQEESWREGIDILSGQASEENSMSSEVQRPRDGQGFRSKLVVSSLPPTQKPWPAAVEESEGENVTLVSETYVAHDNDGLVLAAYYPKYLTARIASKVFKAMLDLFDVYPPPKPSERNLRHTDWESLCNLCGGTGSVGLYHLCTWFEQRSPRQTSMSLRRRPTRACSKNGGTAKIRQVPGTPYVLPFPFVLRPKPRFLGQVNQSRLKHMST